MLTAAIGWLLAYKYYVLFPIAFIEGPIIAIISGSLAASGQINFFAAYAIIVIGDVSADSMYYAFGRYGREKILKRWGHYFGLTPDRMQRVDRHFLNHAGKTLVLGKMAFSFEIPFIVSAGLARFSFIRFVFYMFCGALPKTLALMLVGYFFGFSIAAARKDLAYAAHVSFVVLAIVLILVVIHVILKRSSRVYATHGILGYMRQISKDRQAKATARHTSTKLGKRTQAVTVEIPTSKHKR